MADARRQLPLQSMFLKVREKERLTKGGVKVDVQGKDVGLIGVRLGDEKTNEKVYFEGKISRDVSRGVRRPA